jgi:hypothetical protein
MSGQHKSMPVLRSRQETTAIVIEMPDISTTIYTFVTHNRIR